MPAGYFIEIPQGWILIPPAIPVLLWWRKRRMVKRALQRQRAGLCGKCGYDCRGIAERCPECGTKIPFMEDRKSPARARPSLRLVVRLCVAVCAVKLVLIAVTVWCFGHRANFKLPLYLWLPFSLPMCSPFTEGPDYSLLDLFQFGIAFIINSAFWAWVLAFFWARWSRVPGVVASASTGGG